MKQDKVVKIPAQLNYNVQAIQDFWQARSQPRYT